MKDVRFGSRRIGPGHPTFVIAEVSANHLQSYELAVKIVDAAIDAGADCVKLQTYTADTMTLDVNRPEFQIQSGTIWDGTTLHKLYQGAFTPWEWHAPLFERCKARGVEFFSSPFDATSVDFLQKLDVPAWKIASFELVDLPLIRRCAATGKPMILSTGMAVLAEIDEAVRTAREAGAKEIVLLKTNSAYPAPPEEMNLRTIAHLSAAFDVPAGLSDHTLGTAVPVAAVALGACAIEKHICWERALGGPDAAFSLEPREFAEMVANIRVAEKALGGVSYALTDKQRSSRGFRRSLFVVADVKAGEAFTAENVRAIRPAHGLHTREFDKVIGRRATRDIARGEPLDWSLVG